MGGRDRARYGLALATALVSCQPDSTEPAPEPRLAKPSAPEREVGETDGGSRQNGATRRETLDAMARSAGLTGYVLFGSMGRSVERIRQQVAPRSIGWLLGDDTVRAILRDQSRILRDTGGIAPTNQMIGRFDLVRSIACTVVDPTVLKGSGACVFGYEGGVAQIEKDMVALEPRAVLSPEGEREGHDLRYVVDGKHSFYIDSHGQEGGSGVVVSMHPETNERVADFFKAVTDDLPKLRDFEMILYPSPAIDRYLDAGANKFAALASRRESGAKVRADFEAMAQDDFGSLYWAAIQSDPDTYLSIANGVEKATIADARELGRLAGEIKSLLSEYSRVGLSVNLEAAGLVLDFDYRARPEAGIEPVLKTAPKVDRGMFEALPATSVWAGTAGGAWLSAAEREEGVDRFKAMVATLLALTYQDIIPGKSRAELKHEFEWLARAPSPDTNTRSSWSLFTTSGGIPAVVINLDRGDWNTDRDAWLTWSKRFTPERLLGADLARHMTWEFTPAAATVGDTPVDRVKLWLTPETDDEPGGLLLDWFRPWLIAHFGRELYIDRIERPDAGGRVVYVASQRPPDEAREVVFATGAGAKGLIDVGVPELLGFRPHTTEATGFSVRATRAWLVEQFPGDPLLTLPRDLGSDFSDISQIDSVDAHGGHSELVVSQHLLDQLRSVFGEIAKPKFDDVELPAPLSKGLPSGATPAAPGEK